MLKLDYDYDDMREYISNLLEQCNYVENPAKAVRIVERVLYDLYGDNKSLMDTLNFILEQKYPKA